MSMLEIIEPGLLSTVQDGGRGGWARYGIPASGPLDAAAFSAANALVGNAPGAAGLELTWSGPALRFGRDALVAVCGATFDLWVGQLAVPTWHSLFVRTGQIMRFGARRSGARAYLAVDGGLALPPVLGSQATYLPGGLGGMEGRALRAGDVLPLGAGLREPYARAGEMWPWAQRPAYTGAPVLRAALGPQADYFTQAGLETFLNTPYTLTLAADRMGARLQGAAIAHAGATGIVSDGVTPGCIQVPPDGQPIVMLADHQTTGGYPKIAVVIRADLPLLAQCMPGDVVRFAAIAPAAARRAAMIS